MAIEWDQLGQPAFNRRIETLLYQLPEDPEGRTS